MATSTPGVTAAISAHHRELSEHLAAKVAALEAGTSDGGGLVAFLTNELLPHAAGEEAQLYPVVGQLIRTHGDATATMKLDHEYITSASQRVTTLAQRLRTTSDASERAAVLKELTRAAVQLEAVVGLHTTKEEQAYLPLIARHLSVADQEHLLEDLHETAAAQSAQAASATPRADEQTPATLDVRPLPPARRHTLIFETFDALTPGTSFILVNDHDPKPLYYQLNAERAGQLTWDYLAEGPVEWRVRIGKAQAD